MKFTPRDRLHRWACIVGPSLGVSADVLTKDIVSAAQDEFRRAATLDSLPKSVATKRFNDLLGRDEAAAFATLDDDVRRTLVRSMETDDLATQFLVEGMDVWLSSGGQERLRSAFIASGLTSPADLELAMQGSGSDGINFLLYLVFPQPGIPDLLDVLESTQSMKQALEREVTANRKDVKGSNNERSQSVGDDRSSCASSDAANNSVVGGSRRGAGQRGDASQAKNAKAKECNANKSQAKTSAPKKRDRSEPRTTTATPETATARTSTCSQNGKEVTATPPRANSNGAHSDATKEELRLMAESPRSLDQNRIKELRRPISRGITAFELENHYWVEEIKAYVAQAGIRLPKPKKPLMIKAILKHVEEDG
eukprot:PhM_4_TR2822/c1_g1_i1/m.33151